MPRTRNPYPADFREQIVALARSGRGVEDLAREFEPCVATVHSWVKQADRDSGRRRDGLMERLMKAAGIQASHDLPGRPSSARMRSGRPELLC